jgi:low affinity Fe/Cu permease
LVEVQEPGEPAVRREAEEDWGRLVIQRAEHRDTQAIHAKLDEILHALGDARNEITRMDEKEPEEIERSRARPL